MPAMPTSIETADQAEALPLWTIDRLPQLVWVVDDSGRLVFANQQFLDSFDVTTGTLAPWGRFLSDDAALRFHNAFGLSVRSGRAIEQEALVRFVDGQVRWHLLRATPAAGPGGGRLWYATATDIQNQKAITREVDRLTSQLDEALPRRADSSATGRTMMSPASGERYRKRSELLHEILDCLAEAVVVFDAQGKVLLHNAAAREFFGKDVLATPASEWTQKLPTFQPDGTTLLSADEMPMTRSLRGDRVEHLDLWFHGPEHRRRCAVRGTPLWDGFGGVRGAVTVFRDETDRRRMEDQLAHLQKLEAIGQLASGIAHEINTPIQYVGDNLRFLNGAFRDLSSGNPTADLDFLKKEVPAAVEQSLEGVDRVAAIVRAVREFAAPGPDEPTAVSLNRIVENTIAVTRNVWKYAAEIVADYERELPAIPGHPRDLSQAVYHLLMNAIEAIEHRRPAEGGRIRVRTRLVGDSVVVTVTDNGCGVSPVIRPKVFDPFFTTKAPGKHSGQGLTRVLGCVVKRHFGTVELASEPGSGTTVTARLPLEWPDDFASEMERTVCPAYS